MALVIAMSALWLARRSRRQVHRLAYDLRRSDLIVDLVEADASVDEHVRTLKSLSSDQRGQLNPVSLMQADRLAEMARRAEADVRRLREQIDRMSIDDEPTPSNRRRLEITSDEVRTLQQLAARINREFELLLGELEPTAGPVMMPEG
jgi:hypothetical protein